MFGIAETVDWPIPRNRFRRLDFDRSVFGVRAPVGASDDLATRCRMFQIRLPADSFVSHTTAATLWGIPLPAQNSSVLDVTVPAPHRAPHARSLRGHSRQVLPGDVVVLAGVRVSSAPRVWCELASRLSLADLVAAGDHLIHHRRPLTTTTLLSERIDAGDPISRPRALREALALLSDRADSRPESLVRVMLRFAGLPEPEVNYPIIRGAGGIRADFAYPDRRVAVEYQGDYHREKAQWRADMTRRSRLESMGWMVIELNADDLRDQAELAARIRRILDRRT